MTSPSTTRDNKTAMLFVGGALVAFLAGFQAAAGDDGAPKGPPPPPAFDKAENLLDGADKSLLPPGAPPSTAAPNSAGAVAPAADAPPAEGTVGSPPAPAAVDGAVDGETTPPTADGVPAGSAVEDDEQKLAMLPEEQSDVPDSARAFDADMVDTQYQCSPPALSPHSLLRELKKQADRNQNERERLEKLNDDIDDKRIALAKEMKLLSEKIAEFKKAKSELPPPPLTEDEQKEKEAQQAAAKSKADEEARMREENIRREREAKVRERGLQVAQLAKAMRGMQPPEAAAFLSSLDTNLASEVLKRMRPKDAGAALAKMPPKKAAKLAAKFTSGEDALDSSSSK